MLLFAVSLRIGLYTPFVFGCPQLFFSTFYFCCIVGVRPFCIELSFSHRFGLSTPCVVLCCGERSFCVVSSPSVCRSHVEEAKETQNNECRSRKRAEHASEI